jgi:hypothetical protein
MFVSLAPHRMRVALSWWSWARQAGNPPSAAAARRNFRRDDGYERLTNTRSSIGQTCAFAAAPRYRRNFMIAAALMRVARS